MNEVTTIHLSRQAFTISAGAYHDLRKYIDDISKHVKDQDVMEEIELRMSELLIERGLSSEKVVLETDVDYLKSQLGKPSDFMEDHSEDEPMQTDTKRLFRDTENALIAGVAAGLAKFLGLDVLLVRLLFVLFVVVSVGWGVLLYILLWLLIPEAKTPSERLQMEGKPVNVKSLKAAVEQADVRGVAGRVNRSIAEPINKIFKIFLKIVGVIFVGLGLSAIFWLIAGETYYLARGNDWSKNNIFPVGLPEHVLMYIAMAVIALMAVFIITFGIAIYRRKWPLNAWVTGVLAGLVLIGSSVGGALAADVYPNVRDAYNSNTHVTVRNLNQFSNISVEGDWLDNVDFVQSDKYMVAFSYYGHPDLSSIKTSVNNGTLLIDGSNFHGRRSCNTFCVPNTYLLHVTVYSPNALEFYNKPFPAPMAPMAPPSLPLRGKIF